MDLIDRKHFDKALEDVLVVASGKMALGKGPRLVNELTLDYISKVREWLKEEPSVDAELVVHAHWENIGCLYGNKKVGAATCPICGQTTLWFNPEDFTPENCCWCGAKMNEVKP